MTKDKRATRSIQAEHAKAIEGHPGKGIHDSKPEQKAAVQFAGIPNGNDQ